MSKEKIKQIYDQFEHKDTHMYLNFDLMRVAKKAEGAFILCTFLQYLDSIGYPDIIFDFIATLQKLKGNTDFELISGAQTLIKFKLVKEIGERIERKVFIDYDSYYALMCKYGTGTIEDYKWKNE